LQCENVKESRFDISRIPENVELSNGLVVLPQGEISPIRLDTDPPLIETYLDFSNCFSRGIGIFGAHSNHSLFALS
jgi:hypothetical protein